MSKPSKLSPSEHWAQLMAKSTATPEQKRAATELLLKLIRKRRAWQQAQAVIDVARYGETE